MTRDLSALREADLKGARRHGGRDLRTATEDGERIVLEVAGTGTLAIGIGALRPGTILRTRFTHVFEFKNGLIWRQRNYDCFEAR